MLRGRSSRALQRAPTLTESWSCIDAKAGFAARVDPKIVQLDQNRVDVVFEIHEGDLAKVRAINILGNKAFPGRSASQGDVSRARRAAFLAS